jgi:hypothetical protein
LHRALLLTGLLMGCDVVFSLDRDPQELPDAAMCSDDGDCDDVLDRIDNCVDTPNSDQRDLDADGLGDACDSCSADPPSGGLDSDQDAIKDDRDVCPETSDPDQLDGDGDGIGDACDADPTTSDALRCFFDFDNQLLSVVAWRLDQAIWGNSSGVIFHFGAEPPGHTILDASGLDESVRRFAVATSGHAQDQAVRPTEYGLALGSTPSEAGTRCVLTSTTAFADTIAILGPGGVVLASETWAPDNRRLWIRMTAERGELGTSVTCAIVRNPDPPVILTAMAPPLVGIVPIALVSYQSAASFLDLTIYQLGP